METRTILILGLVGALVVIAIGLIASSGKRLDSTEGERNRICTVRTDTNIL